MNIQTSGEQYYDGCILLSSNKLKPLRRWLWPNWLFLVQLLLIFCLVLMLLIFASILVGMLTKLRKKFYFILFITIMLLCLGRLNCIYFLHILMDVVDYHTKKNFDSFFNSLFCLLFQKKLLFVKIKCF